MDSNFKNDLFDLDVLNEDSGKCVIVKSTEEPEERATRRIKEVLLQGHPLVVAYSAGKDSSTLVGITLTTARDIIANGSMCPPIVIINSDTGVEQPEIVSLAKAEIKKMLAFASIHEIPLEAKIGKPTITASFPVRVIGGRGLPSFPDSRSDCTTDWKISVNQKSQKEVFAQLEGLAQWRRPVVMTGVRLDESIVRDQRISKRGERAEGIWENDFGDLRLSPILDFSVDDVWQFIGLANAGVINTYSDFSETMRIYRDAGGSSCVIVADMKGSSNSKPCGTRTGCWNCCRVSEDKSMEQMIESNPTRYGYLKPLARLRNFISRSQYDWTLRTFVGRTIDEAGYISIGADTYSPDMLQNLLRYTLSAQEQSGVPIISTRQLIAIDARWSQYALCPPFTALRIYFEVMNGAIELAPEIRRVHKTPVPKIGKIQVGHATFNAAMRGNVSGLRHVTMEMHHESCGFELKTLNDGSLVIDVEVDGDLTIDQEGADDFLSFVAEDMIRDYCKAESTDWTFGYKCYLQYGTISISKGRSSQSHEILQRSQWRQLNNLHGQQDRAELESRCDVLFSAQLELI